MVDLVLQVLENLTLLDIHSPDYSQLCILQQGEMASGNGEKQTICFSAVSDMSLMQMDPISALWHLRFGQHIGEMLFKVQGRKQFGVKKLGRA